MLTYNFYVHVYVKNCCPQKLQRNAAVFYGAAGFDVGSKFLTSVTLEPDAALERWISSNLALESGFNSPDRSFPTW